MVLIDASDDDVVIIVIEQGMHDPTSVIVKRGVGACHMSVTESPALSSGVLGRSMGMRDVLLMGVGRNESDKSGQNEGTR